MYLNENGIYCPSTILEHVNYVNEAYFGKTTNLIKLEKAIGELRANYTLKRDYTATPEIKRIENIVKDQFDMDYFSLNIIPQNIPNAFTYTIGTRFDIIKNDLLTKMVIADQKNGYRYRKDNGFCIVVAVYGGVLLDKNITDAEIVALMLHEIGHNFADVISKDIKLANYEWYETFWAYVGLRAVLTLGASLIEDIATWITNQNKYQAKNKEKEKPVGKIAGFLAYVNGKITDFQFNWELFKYSLFSGLLGSFIGQKQIDYSAKTGADTMKKDPSRQNEVIADKFAAIYGYGAEQVTILAKLTTTMLPGQEILSKLPYGNVLLKYSAELGKTSFKYDCHPNLIQRANTMIESLKFELGKKNLDPEIRKIIEKQIKEMEECKKEFMKVRDDDNELAKVEKVYAAVVEKKFPQATTEKLEKEINKQIDDLCNKKYK